MVTKPYLIMNRIHDNNREEAIFKSFRERFEQTTSVSLLHFLFINIFSHLTKQDVKFQMFFPLFSEILIISSLYFSYACNSVVIICLPGDTTHALP